MSSLQVFEGASTRTSVFVMQKGQPTSYSVSYTLWKKTAAGRLDYDSTLEEVTAQTRRLEFFAMPVDAGDPTSAWLTARRKAWTRCIRCWDNPIARLMREPVLGPTVLTGWRLLPHRPDGLVVDAQHHQEGAKREVE